MTRDFSVTVEPTLWKLIKLENINITYANMKEKYHG